MSTHLKTFLIITTLLLLFLFACGNNYHKSADIIEESPAVAATEQQEEVYAMMDMSDYKDEDVSYKQKASIQYAPPTLASDATALNSSIRNFIATSAALSHNDGKHKLIRTARLRFKVEDVVAATATIERAILQKQGLIMNSSISNAKISATSYNISKDSTLVISYNELTGSLSLRVPKDVLDETLREIAPLATEIDYRTLEARDETFNIIWNHMTEQRKQRKAQRLGNSISSRSGKLSDVVDAENSRDQAEETADRVKLNNMILEDQIEYSNIEIQLYQDRIESRKMIENPITIESYKPGFGQKFGDALANGWNAVCVFFLLLVNIWPLLLIIGIGVFIFIRYRKRNK